MKRSMHHMLLVLVLLAWGCGGGGDADRADAAHRDATHAAAQDASHEGDAHHTHGLSATAGPGFTVADVEFMQMMIGHHAQALTMAVMAPARSTDPDILKLAEKIDISQRDEIEFMELWLLERDQPIPEEEHLHSMRMPGLVAPEQLAELEAASGREFDALFLTLMIEHHLGAVEMVDDLFAHPTAAQDPDIFGFVTDVGTDQLDEIGVMEFMLDRLDTTPRSNSR